MCVFRRVFLPLNTKTQVLPIDNIVSNLGAICTEVLCNRFSVSNLNAYMHTSTCPYNAEELPAKEKGWLPQTYTHTHSVLQTLPWAIGACWHNVPSVCTPSGNTSCVLQTATRLLYCAHTMFAAKTKLLSWQEKVPSCSQIFSCMRACISGSIQPDICSKDRKGLKCWQGTYKERDRSLVPSMTYTIMQAWRIQFLIPVYVCRRSARMPGPRGARYWVHPRCLEAASQ